MHFIFKEEKIRFVMRLMVSLGTLSHSAFVITTQTLYYLFFREVTCNSCFETHIFTDGEPEGVDAFITTPSSPIECPLSGLISLLVYYYSLFYVVLVYGLHFCFFLSFISSFKTFLEKLIFVDFIIMQF